MEKSTLKDLQSKCRELGLKATGTKKTLIDRLNGHRTSRSGRNTGSSMDDVLKRLRIVENTCTALSARGSSGSGSDEEYADAPLSSTRHIVHGLTQTTDPPRAIPTTVISTTAPTTAIPTTVTGIATTNHQTGYPGPNPMHLNTSVYPTPCAPGVTPIYSTALPPYPTVAAPYSLHPSTHAPQVHLSSTLPPGYGAWHPNVTGVPGMAPPPTAMPWTPVMHGQTASPFNNLNDIVALLPEFDPAKQESLTSVQFVQRVNLLKDAYQWHDNLLIFAVQHKIKGYAKQWLDAQRIIFKTWAQFVENFTQAFPSEENSVDAHMQMAATNREVNESPKMYFYKMLALGTKFGMTDNIIARYVIMGINDYDLKRKISNDYVRCSDLLRDIENFCKYNEVRSFAAKPPKRSNPIAPEAETLPSKENEDRRTKCYNCLKFGHISNKCPEPQKLERCKNCNKTSHATRDCPQTSTVGQVNRINTQRDVNPELVKVIEINGHTLEAYVDPGSDKTLIKESVAQEFGKMTKCDFTLKGFGGGTFECTTKLAAQVKIDGNAYETDLCIVDDNLIYKDILLGRDVLCQRGRRVIIEGNECWIENTNAATPEITQIQPRTRRQSRLHSRSDAKRRSDRPNLRNGCERNSVSRKQKCYWREPQRRNSVEKRAFSREPQRQISTEKRVYSRQPQRRGFSRERHNTSSGPERERPEKRGSVQNRPQVLRERQLINNKEVMMEGSSTYAVTYEPKTIEKSPTLEKHEARRTQTTSTQSRNKRRDSTSRKLEPKHRGSNVVSKVLANDRYLVGDIPGMCKLDPDEAKTPTIAIRPVARTLHKSGLAELSADH